MNPAIQYFNDLVSLFYPRICPGCGKPMQSSERHICVYCELKLPKTGFGAGIDNPVSAIFKGRIPVVQAAAFMYFRKKGLAQQLMHDLKYNGNKELGFHLGELFGIELCADPAFSRPDLITTVPLHPHKLRKRGYNQSDEIARGLGSALQVSVETGALERSNNMGSQTHRKRFERWENTEHSFYVRNSESIEGKHIALIDDVITTGATLEACGNKLLQVPGVKLSFFSLCMTIH